MDYRKANRLSNIFSLLGIAVAFSLLCFNETNAFFIILAIAAIAFVVYGLIIKIRFYRCPHCHERLPLRTLYLPEYCPGCGKKLE